MTNGTRRRAPRLSFDICLLSLRLVVVLLLDQPRDRDNPVLILDVDQLDALRRPADRADVVRLHPEDHALLGDQQQFVAFLDVRDPDDLTVTVGRRDVDDADTAARLYSILLDFSPLAEAVLGDGQQRAGRL